MRDRISMELRRNACSTKSPIRQPNERQVFLRWLRVHRETHPGRRHINDLFCGQASLLNLTTG